MAQQVIFQHALQAYRSKQPQTTIKLLKPLIKKKPVDQSIYSLYCYALLQLNKLKELDKCIRPWIKAFPKSSDAYFIKAEYFRLNDQGKEALKAYEKAFELNPDNPQLLLSAIALLQKKEDWLRALELSDEYLQCGGDQFQGVISKAVSLYGLHRFEEAQSYLDQAKRLGGDSKLITYYQALLHDKTDRKSIAEKAFLDLINDNYSAAIFPLSLLYFSQGRWQEAFKFYDAREICTSFYQEAANKGLQFWDGEPLEEKKVFVRCEQGLGDQIRYLLFISYLVEHNAEIHLMIDERLFPLVKYNYPLVKLYSANQNTNDIFKNHFDYALVMGSLGKIYFQNLEERSVLPSSSLPFLDVSTDVKNMDLIMDSPFYMDGKPIIGLTWRSIKFMAGRNDSYMSVEDVLQLIDGYDANFVCFQYALDDSERNLFKANGVNLIELESIDLKDDQMAVAGMLSCCDKLFTVSTAMCELAGALGVETHCLSVGEVGWVTAEPHMKGFYPSVHMYYKSPLSDWSSPISALRSTILN